MTAWDIVTAVFVLAGGLFALIGGIGIVRLPDFYARLHGGGMTDTLGAWLVLFGLMFQGGWSLVTVKLAMIGLLLSVTSPTATHALANAAWRHGLRVWTGEGSEEGNGTEGKEAGDVPADG